MKAEDELGQRARWPWQRSLQYRILFAYGAVFLVTLVVLVAWIGDAIYRADLDAGNHELEVAAFLVANEIDDPLGGYTEEFETYSEREDQEDQEDDKSENKNSENGVDLSAAAGAGNLLRRLQRVADRYAADTNAHVTIFNEQGRVLADSGATAAPSSRELSADIEAVLRGSAVVTVRASSAHEGELAIFAAAPIQQNDRVLGFVQVSKPVSAVTADARDVMLRMALAALAALTVATLLAVWIGRQLVQPLRKLEQAALAVAGGDLTQAVAVQSNDEVGALAWAFNAMVGKVRAMLEQQRAFVANASHELRTPLTNIKLRSEALRRLHSTDPQLEQRYLSEIEAEADRLTRLANDLLDLARLEKAAGQPEGEPADIAPVLQRVVGIMQLSAEQMGISLCTAIAADLPRVRVRADDLEVISLNLLDNAVKYTQRGGHVQFEADSTVDGVTIRVADDGPGIPAEDMPHIFERFYRVDKARSRRSSSQNGAGSGAGLGLAIVRELVAQNQGHIDVKAAPGQGTVFVVSFPAVA